MFSDFSDHLKKIYQMFYIIGDIECYFLTY